LQSNPRVRDIVDRANQLPAPAPNCRHRRSRSRQSRRRVRGDSGPRSVERGSLSGSVLIFSKTPRPKTPRSVNTFSKPLKSQGVRDVTHDTMSVGVKFMAKPDARRFILRRETHISARRIVVRSAPAPSSPVPSAHRYATVGLDRSARPNEEASVP
jgi:hypothetical protein